MQTGSNPGFFFFSNLNRMAKGGNSGGYFMLEKFALVSDCPNRFSLG